MPQPVELRFHAVFEFVNAMLLGAVGTAVKNTICFHTVTDDPAATMSTGGRQSVDSTLETIENM
jgi:hypothetical protein